MILELHQQGLSVLAIAERTGHDRKTVRKVFGRGLVVPKYASRTPRPMLLGPYETYLRERVDAWPELSGVRLLHELRERGYAGGVTQLNDFLRAVRPPVVAPFEVRFETLPDARRKSTSRTSWSSSPSSPASGSSPWCLATAATCGASRHRRQRPAAR